MSVYIEHFKNVQKFNSDIWSIYNDLEINIKNKIEMNSIILSTLDIDIKRGILTGLNEAFIINENQYKTLIKKDINNAKIIRPILRGRDIKRFSYVNPNLYMICTFPSKNIDIDEYPALKEYLLSFSIQKLEQTGKEYILNDGTKIKSRKKTNNKWFETQDSISYWEDFFKPKIIYPETTQKANFYLDITDNYFLDKTCFMLLTDYPYYICSLLSSNLYEFAYKHLYSSIELGKNGYQYNKHALLKLPIIKPTKNLEEIFKSFEFNLGIINEYVYKLYNISPKEIEFIEKSNH